MYFYGIFFVLFTLINLISGYIAIDTNKVEDENYEQALLDLIKQRQIFLEREQQLKQELQQLASNDQVISSFSELNKKDNEKRGKNCLKRNANCDGRLNECCAGSTCRCTIIDSNCRCQRPGLFQKFF